MIRLGLLAALLAPLLWAAQAIEGGSAWILPALAVLVLFSAFFSGSEIALVSLSHAKIKALREKNIPGSHAIATLKSRPNRMLITILIGNNLVNIAASVLATAWATSAFGTVALGWVTGVLTLVILIAGEIFPKAIAQHHNELFSRLSAPVLLFLQTLLLPLIVVLEWLLGILMLRTASKKTAHISAVGELKAFIRLVAEKREIDPNLQEILESTFEFDRTQVKAIMTPRDRLITAKTGDSLEALRLLFVKQGRSRIPVFEGDRVAGLVNMHLLLEAQIEGKTQVGQVALIPVLSIDAEAFIDDLLLILQEANQQLALVYSQGELVGLVTVENILEEIVGEMHDEKEPAFRRALFGGKR
ncbi:MAG: CNNM domain-containing protein [Campylobacterales bacterium]